MKILTFKPLLALLIYGLFFIALLIPSLGFAYSGKHHGHSHNRHYGYRHFGYSRHYGNRRFGRRRYYPGKYYRRKHFGYSRRRYRNYPRSYSLAIPKNVVAYVDNDSNQYGKSNHTVFNSSAWDTLNQGQYNEALRIFAQQAQSNPGLGVPKAGYALATASVGDLDRGVWAMRRAFQIDPDSLHYLQLDEQGHKVIDNLIDQYSSNENDADNGQAFMVSALYYLKHDYAAAKQAIANVQQYGDTNLSYMNLQRLIDKELGGQGN